MELKKLEKLGLNKNEVRVYSALIKRGISTTGPLIKELGISSSRIYASLQDLIKRGLVTYFVKNNVNHYQAENPKYFLKMVDELKTELKQVVQDLDKLKEYKEEKEYSVLFEGFNGFKQAFELILNECTKDDELLTVGFSPPEYAFTTLRNYLRKTDRERYKKKIPMKIIFDIKMKNTIGKDREKEPFTRVKYLPKGYITPAAMSIFKDYVIQWVWKEKPVIFVIKSKEVNESFRNYFKLLWDTAK